MTEMKFYKCKHCGKIIALVQGPAAVPTICCGEPMVELVPNTEDGAHEKHIPVYKVDRENNTVTVKIGEVDHPMVDVHYIQWVVLQTTKGNQRKELAPGNAPVVTFKIDEDEDVIAVLEYCNLHGLYKA